LPAVSAIDAVLSIHVCEHPSRAVISHDFLRNIPWSIETSLGESETPERGSEESIVAA
jgi:hypothetical protein